MWMWSTLTCLSDCGIDFFELHFGWYSTKLKHWNKTLAEKIVCKHNAYLYISGWFQTLCPCRNDVTNRESWRLHSQRTLQKNQITITKHLIWDTFDINWSSVMLKLGNADITLPTLVAVPLMDKYRVRSIMESNYLNSYIILLTGVTWHGPHKFNAVAIQDINHSV